MHQPILDIKRLINSILVKKCVPVQDGTLWSIGELFRIVAQPETGLINLGDEHQPKYAWDPKIGDAFENLASVRYPYINNFNLFAEPVPITITRALGGV